MNLENRIKIAITMGDPAGIGPELCLRLLAEPAALQRCVPVVFGDAGVLERVARRISLSLPESVISLDDWNSDAQAPDGVVVDCPAIADGDVEPGAVSASCGAMAYRYIEASIHSALRGAVSAVVTAPINKESLNLAGIRYPGHTEIFTALTGAARSCMMLASNEIITSFVTTHTAIADVPARLTIERISDVIELTDDAVRLLIGKDPSISVCGLNPHSGEHGLFGNEEQNFIEPAIRAAREKGLNVDGPVPSDSAFIPSRRASTDAFVCMYHDQGHIPFKMLAFETGVNITLGLPIVRTSVDHGTAFDIAWTGRANPTSLFKALEYAVRLSAGRRFA